VLETPAAGAHLAIAIGAAALAVFAALAVTEIGWTPLADSRVRWIVAGLLVIAAGIVASVDDRVAAIAALGAVGFLVAAWYVLYGAPQLAAVQLVVDGLTIALAVFILRHLPRRYPHVPRFERAGAACLALAGGAVVVLFSLLTRDVALPPASVAYFEEAWALRAANVVNAILAEFRGLDTVGETAVVGIAALGVAAVLKRRSAR
jgi:multicomponent Na+:H+ antiporter subunit A